MACHVPVIQDDEEGTCTPNVSKIKKDSKIASDIGKKLSKNCFLHLRNSAAYKRRSMRA